MDYPEQAFICERCNQLCYRPVTVHLALPASTKVLRICRICFEEAIERSGGTVHADMAGTVDVILPRPEAKP